MNSLEALYQINSSHRNTLSQAHYDLFECTSTINPGPSFYRVSDASLRRARSRGLRTWALARDPGVWTMARVFGAKTPLLGKGGVAAPIKKKRRSLLSGRRRGGSFKPPIIGS